MRRSTSYAIYLTRELEAINFTQTCASERHTHSHMESSHTEAMNMLLDRIFEAGYQVAFNVNLDDYYAPTRFEEQVA